ncbi:MAG TPA: hypothetical protein VM075_05290 [Anaerolineae bacterium]|nr:hypothetical protein [Anaerolineae bacterium]
MRMLLLVALMLLVSSCVPVPEQTGVLEGHVTIGPLVPVVREGEPEPTPGPKVYASRQIVIYAQDGQTEVARVQIDGQGNYRVELAVGTYVVDINHVGIDSAKELPRTVEIAAGQVTLLDVEIDTGIR